jgi:hypothetical protein
MSRTQSSDRSLECGCTDTDQATISLPGIGPMCRTCHTPAQLHKWPLIAREDTLNTRDGHFHHETWLVALDSVGRGLYFDERNNSLLTVALEHHRGFRPDFGGDDRPLRPYPPQHGPSGTSVVNADTGHTLAIVDHEPVSRRGLNGGKTLAETIIETAPTDEWQAVTGAAVELVANSYADVTDEFLEYLEGRLARWTDSQMDRGCEPPLNFIPDARDLLEQHD